jgi:Ribbon-helix-helix protein, copG family
MQSSERAISLGNTPHLAQCAAMLGKAGCLPGELRELNESNFCVRMPASLLASIDNAVKLREQTRTQFIRLAIREKLARIEAESADRSLHRDTDDGDR